MGPPASPSSVPKEACPLHPWAKTIGRWSDFGYEEWRHLLTDLLGRRRVLLVGKVVPWAFSIQPLKGGGGLLRQKAYLISRTLSHREWGRSFETIPVTRFGEMWEEWGASKEGGQCKNENTLLRSILLEYLWFNGTSIGTFGTRYRNGRVQSPTCSYVSSCLHVRWRQLFSIQVCNI